MWCKFHAIAAAWHHNFWSSKYILRVPGWGNHSKIELVIQIASYLSLLSLYLQAYCFSGRSLTLLRSEEEKIIILCIISNYMYNNYLKSANSKEQTHFYASWSSLPAGKINNEHTWSSWLKIEDCLGSIIHMMVMLHYPHKLTKSAQGHHPSSPEINTHSGPRF